MFASRRIARRSGRRTALRPRDDHPDRTMHGFRSCRTLQPIGVRHVAGALVNVHRGKERR